VREEENILIVIISATIILLLLVTFIVLFLFVYQKRVYRHKRQVQKMQEDFKQEMVNSKMELQEQVLNSVSEEIHDNLGQMLSVVKLNLAKLGRMASRDENETEVINELKGQISGVINDMRSISKTLSKDFVADFGLVESLKVELARIKRTGEIDTIFNTGGEDKLYFDGQSQIVLFRIAQELINNAIKHAEAKQITVEVIFSNESLRMTIADDGMGFDTETIKLKNSFTSGNGLRNMKNRVKIIGGVLHLKSTIGKGTTATIEINTQSSLFINSKKQ
jgi:signal transduction histidine kinase